jgi:signal transduction histidine kinase
MLTALKQKFSRLDFSRQFMLAILAVLMIGMITIGSWVGQQIETSEINRASEISAIYVESIITAQLHGWSGGAITSDEKRAALDQIFVEGPLHHKVVRFKLWDAGGHIDYSNDHAQIGLHFPVKGKLAAAFAGSVQSRISHLRESDNNPEQAHWQQLLEVYVPIGSGANGNILAVAEFYLSIDKMMHEIREAQLRSWALVAVATLAVYLLLFRLVTHASNTIRDQERDLLHKIQQLRAALDENDHMRERLREAGVSTTSLNEEFLLRIAADLHDGPAQTMAFALMRFDNLAANCLDCTSSSRAVSQDLNKIHIALQSSLQDVRKISSGLALPDLAELSLADTARRAVRDFEGVYGQIVQTEIEEDITLDNAPLAVKITVYRLLQESLTNCRRHAPGGEPRVQVKQADGQVHVTITDHGAGFDPQSVAVGGRLGLTFMRERVRLIGGIFEIDSSQEYGTRIQAKLPISNNEMIHA